MNSWKIIGILFFTMSVFISHGQSNTVDSIRMILKDDVISVKDKLDAGLNFVDQHVFVDPIETRELTVSILEMAKKEKDELSVAVSHSIIGISYYLEGNYPASIDSYRECLKFYDPKRYKVEVNRVNQMIAITYFAIQDWEKCLEYNRICLKFSKRIKDTVSIISLLNNIGLVYAEQGNHRRAISYYREGLDLGLQRGSESELADLYHNTGQSQVKLEEIDLAFENLQLAYNIRLENQDSYGLLSSYSEFGLFLAQIGEFNRAQKFCDEGLVIASSTKQSQARMICLKCLAEVHRGKGEMTVAIDYYKRYIALSDSVSSENMASQITKREAYFDHRQEKLKDSLEFVKTSALKKLGFEQGLRNERMIKYLLYAGLFGVVLLIFYVLYRIRVIRKKNNEISEQKQIVEEKNLEITDSINYAERLQRATLPSIENLKLAFDDLFLIYRPKNIVSGDFYWFRKIEDTLLIAVADCTGHGVPGAMVSVVCTNALQRSIDEFGLLEPNEILERCRTLVIETFTTAENTINDGMDIALCAINLKSKKGSFAGANNPLWIIRQETGLEEIKPNKQPIGRYVHEEPFDCVEFEWSNSDFLVMFSDGYADQFGGPKGKKLKKGAFKKIILEALQSDEPDKSVFIENHFESWKGSLEQIDDVCVLGFRL